MDRLYFTCPVTGQTVDVGIDSELNTLLKIRDKRISASCSSCGGRHEWKVAEAHLQQAA